MVEKRFALSGASSVSYSETEEAPEKVKRFSNIPFPSLSDVLAEKTMGNVLKY